MNTYGKLDNASLVHMYGFAEHNNPNDMVSLHVCSCTLHDGMAGIYSCISGQAVVG